MKIISNSGIEKPVPFLFSELEDYISLRYCGDPDKIGVVLLFEDEYFVDVHRE